MSVKIIIDSTTDTTPEVREKCAVVPLMVRFGETEYVDDVNITYQEFYKMLVESQDLPTTSQPTPDAFAQEYKKAVDAGHKVVVITIASKLSGTYQSATIAAMDFPGSVFVVDSKTVTIGAGILVEMAVKMAESGMAAEDIAKKITEEREKVRIIAMVDTLEYLKKGGRISKTVAFAGELLSLKPIISVQDGEIHTLGKARGSRQANGLVNKQIEDMGGIDLDKPIQPGFTGLSDELLQKYLEESAESLGNRKDLYRAPIGSVIGTHAGPGAFALAFFVN